ncbi:MAG: hypothetical protein AMXMBFR36_06360 [Acidobacteriota bacterium]
MTEPHWAWNCGPSGSSIRRLPGSQTWAGAVTAVNHAHASIHFRRGCRLEIRIRFSFMVVLPVAPREPRTVRSRPGSIRLEWILGRSVGNGTALGAGPREGASEAGNA